MAQDLQGAAVRYLLTIPEVVAAVGKYPDSDKPYIFRDEILVNLEDGHYTSVSAVVVEDGGAIDFGARGRYRGRRLAVTIWANGDRDATGNLVGSKSVRIKINDTFNVIDKYLHKTDAGVMIWDEYVITDCNRLIDLSKPIAVTDGDGIMIATAYYAVFF